jgi:hypothetical protein
LSRKELIELERQFNGDVLIEYVMIDDGTGHNNYKELRNSKKNYPEKVKLIKL